MALSFGFLSVKSRRRFMLLDKARSKVCATARRFDAAAGCDVRAAKQRSPLL